MSDVLDKRSFLSPKNTFKTVDNASNIIAKTG